LSLSSAFSENPFLKERIAWEFLIFFPPSRANILGVGREH